MSWITIPIKILKKHLFIFHFKCDMTFFELCSHVKGIQSNGYSQERTKIRRCDQKLSIFYWFGDKSQHSSVGFVYKFGEAMFLAVNPSQLWGLRRGIIVNKLFSVDQLRLNSESLCAPYLQPCSITKLCLVNHLSNSAWRNG